MGWRGTLALALLLVAAGAWLGLELARERGPLSFESLVGMRRDPPPGEQITHLLDFDPATITAVQLQRGAQVARSERLPAGWSGTAHPEAVDDFLVSLTELAEVMPLEVPRDELADHGLAPPRAVIELSRAGASPLVVHLGDPNPPATGVYAQLGPDGRVVLTGALALWELDKVLRALSPTAAATP